MKAHFRPYHPHTQTNTPTCSHLSVILHSREQREEVEQEANGYVCLPICPWHDQLISRLIHCHHGLITFPFKLQMDFFKASSSIPISTACVWRGCTVEVCVCGHLWSSNTAQPSPAFIYLWAWDKSLISAVKAHLESPLSQSLLFSISYGVQLR